MRLFVLLDPTANIALTEVRAILANKNYPRERYDILPLEREQLPDNRIHSEELVWRLAREAKRVLVQYNAFCCIIVYRKWYKHGGANVAYTLHRTLGEGSFTLSQGGGYSQNPICKSTSLETLSALIEVEFATA